MDEFLNVASFVGSFLLTFSALYFIQYFTLGFIPLFKKEIKNTISIGDIVFPAISLIIIILFIDFGKIN